MSRILSWVLSLAVLAACSVLAVPAVSDEGRDSVAVPAGYVMVIPPSSLHSQDQADVDRPDYAGKSFRVDNMGISYPELIERLVDLAKESFDKREAHLL